LALANADVAAIQSTAADTTRGNLGKVASMVVAPLIPDTEL
jgi:hypothetical protein